jgi:hypothetical protein
MWSEWGKHHFEGNNHLFALNIKKWKVEEQSMGK